MTIQSTVSATGALVKDMKRLIIYIVAATVIFIGEMDAMAIEEAQYDVVKKESRFEVRDYAPHILAETIVEGGLEDAGSKAFNTLFRYISGEQQVQSQSTNDCSGIPKFSW